MIIKNSASKASIEDFRDHVAQGLWPASGALINLIDVLAIGPRPASPVERTLSPLLGYWWSSLYTAENRASQELAETISIGLPEEIDRADGEIGSPLLHFRHSSRAMSPYLKAFSRV